MFNLARLRYKAGLLISPEIRSELETVRKHADQFGDTTREIINFVSPFTMTSVERISHLVDSVRYVHSNGIKGSIVECGVWRGGSMMAVARCLMGLNDRSRDLYLFDTFEGMPPPSDEDVEHSGRKAAEILAEQDRAEERNVWAYSPFEDVLSNMKKTGYPVDKIHFVQGKVEDTVPEQAPEAIALLRLDTDWYESTKHELEHLYDRISPRGILIIDDYGWWKGSRKAVDEFFASRPFKPLLHRIDESGRSVIKE